MRPFRFGVTATATGDLPAWTATARRVESSGADTLLLPDTAAGPSPLPALAAAAAATTRLRVGSWVLCAPLHEPTRLLREVATIHALVGDRFELGLGAGRPGAERDAAALGRPYGSPAERVDSLVEMITGVRAALPAATMLVAAAGPRLCRIAGELADVVALGWPPDTGPAEARAVVDRVPDGAERAAGLIAVAEVAAPWLARSGITASRLAALDAVSAVSGSPRQMADTLLRRRDQLGVSYWTVPEAALPAFDPVVGLLAGR